MPYIKKEDRGNFIFTNIAPQHPGELNYCFTLISQLYLAEHGLNYQHINDVIGALECCKMELQRRIIGAYEDKKIAQNGDVMVNLL